MKQKIYLDNNATTAVDPKVIDSITSHLKSHFGNPSSAHSFGKQARSDLQKARDSIASYFNVLPREIIFTSGATESLNLVIRGLCKDGKQHIVTSDVEHPAVYSTLKSLESDEFSVTYLKVGSHGAPTLEAVKNVCTNQTSLIVLMAVNNETGVKTDIEGIAVFAKEKGIPFIVDGVALLGKDLFTIPEGVSCLCFSGHKIHALKGIGFAFIRKHLRLSALQTGGDQEFGMRGGTENMIGILSLAENIQLLKESLEGDIKRMAFLRDRLEKGILSKLPNVKVNGTGPRVCNTSNLLFKGIEGEVLMANLDMAGIAVSLGSACASGALEPSRVLLNMGLSTDDASSSLRFSLSRNTTEDEIDYVIDAVQRIVQRLIQ